MNTNIITQLAKVIGPETKESFAVIKKDINQYISSSTFS